MVQNLLYVQIKSQCVCLFSYPLTQTQILLYKKQLLSCNNLQNLAHFGAILALKASPVG